MSTAPIQYSGSAISSEVPWETRRHLQLLYQKLANHTQAFGLIQESVAKVTKTASTPSASSSSSSVSPLVSTSSAISVNGGTLSTTINTVNDLGVATSYTTQVGDNGAVIVLDASSSSAVTLASQSPPWGAIFINLGSGTATLTPASGTISYQGNSAASSMPVPSGGFALVAFDGTNWWGSTIQSSSGGTITDVVAGTGLTGGGSSGSVTLAIAATAVTAASYTNTNLTVNAEGQITAASNGSSGSYIKGSVTIGPEAGAGTYTATGTVTGAIMGSAAIVGVSNSTEAAVLSNLIAWVPSNGTVGIQITTSGAILAIILPVVVFN